MAMGSPPRLTGEPAVDGALWRLTILVGEIAGATLQHAQGRANNPSEGRAERGPRPTREHHGKGHSDDQPDQSSHATGQS